MNSPTMEQAKCPIKVVIADDHPLFREALRKLLETDPTLQLIGEASDGHEAIRLVRELRPDLLLLDFAMPLVPGLDTLRELSTMTPAIRTLLLTASVDDADVVEALQLGARGVVMKHTASELLFKGIRTVMAGEYWVGRECMGNVIDKMRARASAPEPVQRGSTFGLTARELQMVSTVVAGYPNNDIAAKFSISVKTVKHHLTNIFDKLGVSNRLELALFAVHHHIDSGPAPTPDCDSSRHVRLL